jgi:V-type H+-transporting ATPase subunit a
MARRVRFFDSQIEKEKDVVPIRPLYDSAFLVTVGPSAAHNIDELDVTLAEHETRLLRMNESYKLLSERTKEHIEARHVLRETARFFEKASQLDGSLHYAYSSSRLKRSRRISEPLSMIVQHLFSNMMIAKTSTRRQSSSI